MKKIDKKDFGCCFLLIVFFLAYVFIVTQFKYFYGSTLDWNAQHSIIPEYFRSLFYKTGDLFPDFAFNLGSGQNIYNFSYYGLLSPIILFSYFFPFVSMPDYIGISSIICIMASSIIFYVWLRRNNNGGYISSFLSSFALMFAVSMSFHSHRHIMFVNYMPFLILGLFGIDKKLAYKKGWLLSLSVFLMIMTSYYYSIGGIICLIIYGVYKYIKCTKDITIKSFFVDGFKVIMPIIVGVLCASIIILPTFYVILNGRGTTFNSITLKDLLVPSLNIRYVMYNSYGMGLTSILIFGIISLLLRKRENLYLGIVMSLVILFPFVNYILNATMYIDSKALIPLLPIAVFTIFLFLEQLINKRIDMKKIFMVAAIVGILSLFKGNIALIFSLDLVILSIFIILNRHFDKVIFLIIPCIFIPFSASLYASSKDSLVERQELKDDNKIKEIVDYITRSDEDIYRITNLNASNQNMNNLYGNIDYYTSTLYSSTYNMDYNKFYYDVINNPIQSRNRVITSSSNNIMFLLFSSNKYLISKDVPVHGYHEILNKNGYKIYKNEDVLPIFYAQSNVMDEKKFDNLGYPFQSEALLKNVVVEDLNNNNFVSKIHKENIDLKKIKFENVEISKVNNYYLVNVSKLGQGTFQLPAELKNKILFIRFKILESASCRKGDTYIKINGVKNKLTCKEWKYHNQNYDFDYVLSTESLNNLIIELSKGSHKISDIEMYSLDYDDIKDVKSNVDEFQFDKLKTKGDVIEGDIDVKKDGYFVTSIPYDEGFEIDVDGKRVSYLKVNKGFVGFKINEGNHHIRIEYKSPYKNYSVIISCVGILLFVVFIVFENHKYKNFEIHL